MLTYQQLFTKHSPVTAPRSTAQPVPGPRYEALLQLLRTAESLWNASRVFFARWELSPSQFNLLNLLRARPDGLSQTELSRALIMHRSNVTGLIDRLEDRGLVARRDSPDDRRAYRVVLTAAGRKLLESILPEYYQAAEQVWGGLPVPQAKRLVAHLAQLSRNAEQLGPSGKGHEN
ncbi:MAG: MarR family transcriptional regulator [Verrucomicrobiota bacterium]